MKYVIISIVAIAAVFGLSFLITGLIRRKLKRKPPMWGHILISIGSGVAALGVAFLIFANIHYPADAEAKKVLNEPGSIKVSGIDGVVLLASYPNRAMNKDTRLLSIYGSEDKVLERGAYEDARSYFPQNAYEVIIEGGNHAGFGNYGKQNGDGTAAISSEEQQEKTVEEILKLLENAL